MVKELGKQAGSNFERFPATGPRALWPQLTIAKRLSGDSLDEPGIEAPVNGSSNYNCSKVAKYLVG